MNIKTESRVPITTALAMLLLSSGRAPADVVFSNGLGLTIPTTFAGVSVSVGDGTFNPFFGGVYVANDANFQPFRTGTDGLSTMMGFGFDAAIGAGAGSLASGSGGSLDHLGTTFIAGNEGYVGFQLDGANYGWMRVVFTNNASGAVIKDWAYDDSGATIRAGTVTQDLIGGQQTVTLSPQGTETLTMASTSVFSSNVAVVKNGTGTAVLKAANNYTGATTVNAGTLAINGDQHLATGNVTVSNTGTRLQGTGIIGGATTIGAGAIHAPGNGIGAQTFANGLNYGSGSIFEWELNYAAGGVGARGTNYDAVNVTGGNLTGSGSGQVFRVVLPGSGSFADTFWQQNLTWSDIFKDSANPLACNGIFNLASFQFVNSLGTSESPTGHGYFSYTNGGTALTWTAVPEVSNALAAVLLGAGLLRRRREA